MNKSFSDCSLGKYVSFTINHLKPAEVIQLITFLVNIGDILHLWAVFQSMQYVTPESAEPT